MDGHPCDSVKLAQKISSELMCASVIQKFKLTLQACLCVAFDEVFSIKNILWNPKTTMW